MRVGLEVVDARPGPSGPGTGAKLSVGNVELLAASFCCGLWSESRVGAPEPVTSRSSLCSVVRETEC